MKKISRRAFLTKVVAGGAGLLGTGLLASCASPTPQVVEKVVTQVIEKEVTKIVEGTPQVVKETVVVEQAAAKFSGKLTFACGSGYIPRERLETDRWDPPSYMNVLIDGYKEMYPEVEVELQDWVPIWQPEGVAKLTTGMMTGTAPDIVLNWAWSVEANLDKGWFLQLDPYYDMPTPYVEGNQHWRDTFIPEMLAACKLTDGHVYTVPGSVVATLIYYNKDMFKELGLEGAPETWAEWMAQHQTIKDAGYMPIAISMGPSSGLVDWAWRYIMDMVMDSKWAEIAGKPYDQLRGYGSGEGFDAKTLARAIRDHKYDATDPQFLETPRILKDWSQYWPEGFNQDLPNDEYFVTGKAAMYWSGTWTLKQMEYDDRLSFDWGVLRVTLPTITKETSEYATGVKAAFQAGYDTPFSVTAASAQKDLAVDWLMWFTAPQNAGPFFTDLGTLAPSVQGAEVSPALQPVMETMADPSLRLCPRVGVGSDGLDAQCWDETYKQLQAYVGGEITLEQFGENVEEILLATADRLLVETTPEA